LAYSELELGDPLFHFTNVDAFKSIASSGQIRFSRTDQTNDPFEVVWVRKEILNFLSFMLENDSAEATSGIWEAVKHSFEEVSDPSRLFLSCWTQKLNSIPMWRLYAAEGSGVAFSLRSRAFDAFDCRLNKVEYLEDNVPTLEYLKKYTARAAGEFLGGPADLRHVPYTVRLVEAALSTKQSQWDYEKEFRFSFSYNEDQYASIKELVDETLYDRMSQYVPSQIRADSERQFLPKPFGKRNGDKIDKSGSISELILGARCSWSIDQAEDFLRDEGFKNFTVSRSEINWK
jgi:hypothetical protein